MLRLVLSVCALMFVADAQAQVLLSGNSKLAAVAVEVDGQIFVATTDGVSKLVNGQLQSLAMGLDQPCALALYRNSVFVAERSRVIRIDEKGKVHPIPASFPTPFGRITSMTIDPETGNIFVGSDRGDIFAINANGKVTAIASSLPHDCLNLNGQSRLLVGNGNAITELKLSSKDRATYAPIPAQTLCWDHHGRLFALDAKNKKILGVPMPGATAVALTAELKNPKSMSYDPAKKRLLVIDGESLMAVPASIPGFEVDETPMPLKSEVAFPNLKWEGWESTTETGKPNEFRPIGMAHAGDGSNRNFIIEEHGRVYVFPNRNDATEGKLFLDLTDRVSYLDRQNEEGLLGLAFHPKFKLNGEFFVFYTPKKPALTNHVSRFRVKKDDPTKGDPASEEILMSFTKPYWNHDGGTICFGPDGYLYVTHGDGGAANDPHDNASNLKSLLGKVHRIDVDRRDAGKNYAIPADNPFVGKRDALPEIWAYGVRNFWRMSFDRGTGQLWAADVGQNLYEEINIIQRGGHYGWNRREGRHPFGSKGVAQSNDMVEPIWEYHHDIGKSITGGHVYRGKRVPELAGHYLYADYVSARIWALKHEPKVGRVVANREIPGNKLPVFSFGESEDGDVFWMTATTSGQGIYRFAK